MVSGGGLTHGAAATAAFELRGCATFSSTLSRRPPPSHARVTRAVLLRTADAHHAFDRGARARGRSCAQQPASSFDRSARSTMADDARATYTAELRGLNAQFARCVALVGDGGGRASVCIRRGNGDRGRRRRASLERLPSHTHTPAAGSRSTRPSARTRCGRPRARTMWRTRGAWRRS